MRNKFILFFVCLLVCAMSAAAHPLGNFTVNNFSRINLETDQIRLRCVLDMAEISTFQESQQIDTDKNGELSKDELDAYLTKITPVYIGQLKLTVDDQPLKIEPVDQDISLPAGSGNLPTLRIEWDFTAALPALAKDSVHHIEFENENHKERIGWNEIVVSRAPGIDIFDSTAFGSQLSGELKTYPEDMLTAPLTERKAEFSYTTANVPANARELQNRNGKLSAPVRKDSLGELINDQEITPAVVLFGLLIAFGLGMIHALSPGHGKTIVGAYLVGSKGTFKHAIFLGLTVTITHTIGVFALGLITLFAAEYILPERLLPYLSFISGLIVLIMGLALFKERLLTALGYNKKNADETDEHEHLAADALDDDFVHTHGGSTHTHLPPKNVSWRSLLALGISGGLLPCPSALVLMLAAIGAGKVAYGIVLTLAFSFGLAATLMGIGLAFLYVGKYLDRPSLSSNPLVKILPVLSAFVIACVGIGICYYSFSGNL